MVCISATPVFLKLPRNEKHTLKENGDKQAVDSHTMRRATVAVRHARPVIRRRGSLRVAGRYSTARRFSSDVTVDQKVLGVGVCGRVHLAKHHQSGAYFAVKTLSKKGLAEARRKDLKSEVNVYLSLDHPHVARLERVYETDEAVHFLMEHLQGGELFDRILQADRGRFYEAEAAVAMRQILLAVSYLHAKQVVHCDLKPENFVYESESGCHLKLIDFGVSKHWDGRTPLSAPCGSLAFVAPEVVQRSYTESADIWSLGVIAFVLLCGATPWRGTDAEVLQAVTAGRPHLWTSRFEPLCDDAKAFVQALLVADPGRRPSAAQALGHCWIQAHHVAVDASDAALVQRFRRFVTASPMKRVCLSMAAWGMRLSLPGDEVTQLRQQFLAFGSDHRGTINRTEFGQALAPFGMSERETTEIFCSIDLNGDGFISYSEFIAAAISDPERLEEATLRLTFDRFDADGSGTITAGNVREVLGGAYEEHGAEELIRDADNDGDGAVTFEGFCNYLKCQRRRPHAEKALHERATPPENHGLPEQDKSTFGFDGGSTPSADSGSLSDADTQASDPEQNGAFAPCADSSLADAPWYRNIIAFAWAGH